MDAKSDANSESILMTIDEIYPVVRQKLKNKSLTKEDILSAIHELDKKNEEEGKPTLKGLSLRGWMLMGIDTLANYINTKTGGRRKRRTRKSRRPRRRSSKQ